MEKKAKKPIFKRWWFWVLLVLIGISALAAGRSGGDGTPVTTQEVQTRQGAQAETEPAAVPVEYTADADSLKELLSAVLPDTEGVEIFDDEAGWNVTFTYTGTTWDETSLLRKILSGYVDFCREAYEIEGVDSVLFYTSANGTDGRGQPATFQVFNICMNKDKFAAYNWDAMKARSGSYEQIEADCEVFWIHPGVLGSAKTEKIYYS